MTGVQTCALPIWGEEGATSSCFDMDGAQVCRPLWLQWAGWLPAEPCPASPWLQVPHEGSHCQPAATPKCPGGVTALGWKRVHAEHPVTCRPLLETDRHFLPATQGPARSPGGCRRNASRKMKTDAPSAAVPIDGLLPDHSSFGHTLLFR